jgi:hypothetical protein
MLRQALDAAAKGEQQEQEQQGGIEPQRASEKDSLLPSNLTLDANYSSTRSAQHGDDGSETRSYDEEEDERFLMEDWHDEEGSEAEIVPTLFTKTCEAIKSCFILVVNVENLWDSPSQNNEHVREISRRNHYIVFLWFFILAISYALERSTFKLLVDRTGPFRLFAVEMVTFTHALMIGLGMLISAFSRKDFSIHALGIPVVDVGRKLMHSILFLPSFFSGSMVETPLFFSSCSDGSFGHGPYAFSLPYWIPCGTNSYGDPGAIYLAVDGTDNAILAFRRLYQKVLRVGHRSNREGERKWHSIGRATATGLGRTFNRAHSWFDHH